jgi:hypothetical protein
VLQIALCQRSVTHFVWTHPAIIGVAPWTLKSAAKLSPEIDA